MQQVDGKRSIYHYYYCATVNACLKVTTRRGGKKPLACSIVFDRERGMNHWMCAGFCVERESMHRLLIVRSDRGGKRSLSRALVRWGKDEDPVHRFKWWWWWWWWWSWCMVGNFFEVGIGLEIVVVFHHVVRVDKHVMGWSDVMYFVVRAVIIKCGGGVWWYV